MIAMFTPGVRLRFVQRGSKSDGAMHASQC
jgi:hypothetical protein